jgi:hypothetical protein
MPERFSEESAKKGSQLIKIVGSDHIDVVSSCQFGALLDAWEAEDYKRNLLAQSGLIAYPGDDWKYLINVKSQTDKNQVRTVKAGLQDRFLLISGRIHLIAAGCQQSVYSIARLFHILNDKDDQTLFWSRCHGVYQATSFS